MSSASRGRRVPPTNSLICLRQRPLLSGVPQPVPPVFALALPHSNFFWFSRILKHCCFVDGHPSYFLVFYGFLKAYFFSFNFYKFEWGGGRHIFLVFLCWPSLSPVAVYFSFLIRSEFPLFFLSGGNYHCFRGRVAAGTLWTEGQPARLPSVVWMIFFPYQLDSFGHPFFLNSRMSQLKSLWPSGRPIAIARVK